MSEKSRARHIQRAVGCTYQQALAKIREHDARSRDLAEEYSWPLSRADLYLIDPDQDTEVRELYALGARYISEERCDNCWRVFFAGADKKGLHIGSDTFCDDCIPSTTECPRCGQEVLKAKMNGVCTSCWDDYMRND